MVIAPGERERVDDERRAVGTVGLKAGTGIGILAIPVKAIPIECTACELGNKAREISVGFRVERNHVGMVILDHHVGTAAFGRPDTEEYPVSVYFRSQS
jgi:hypothetical protein